MEFSNESGNENSDEINLDTGQKESESGIETFGSQSLQLKKVRKSVNELNK
jgi:hypothetical protein